MAELTGAIEKSGILVALRPEQRPEKAAPRERNDVAVQFRAFRDYAIAASRFSESARSLAQIFKIEPLEDPDVWVRLAGREETPTHVKLARALTTVQQELPKIVSLFQQDTIHPKADQSNADNSTPSLAIVRITFIEEDHRFSTVQRVIDGLSACQELYDGLQRMAGEPPISLGIGAIDSGSDKSFDLFGAAALIKELRDLLISLWGLVVFHRENKLGKRLELIASSLPILERVNSLEQTNRLGREEAQIVRNLLLDGAKKFVESGLITEDLEQHSVQSPRRLLAPEQKLLAGPSQMPAASPGPTPQPERDPPRSGPGRNLSDADLEALANILNRRDGGSPNDQNGEGNDSKGDA